MYTNISIISCCKIESEAVTEIWDSLMAGDFGSLNDSVSSVDRSLFDPLLPIDGAIFTSVKEKLFS